MSGNRPGKSGMIAEFPYNYNLIKQKILDFEGSPKCQHSLLQYDILILMIMNT